MKGKKTSLKVQIAISSVIILVILLIAAAAPLIAPYEQDETNFSVMLQSPNWDYIMGTDQEGRDMLSRIIYGSRVSMIVALATALIALIVGTAYGAVSGYIGGKTDEFLMRIVEVFYSLPDILVIVLLTLIIGRGILGIVIALGFTSWMRVARIVRGGVIQVKSYEYVESARALGAQPIAIFFRHVLPNILGSIIVTITFAIPYAILAESTLSFLGLGIAPPDSSWGTLASTGWQGIRTFPHLILFPSLAIFITTFSFNLLGEGLRDLIDIDTNRVSV